MTKIYNLVAVWYDEKKQLQATRVAEGPSSNLVVDLVNCPPNTHRIAVMTKKVYENLLEQQRVRAASSESAPQKSDE